MAKKKDKDSRGGGQPASFEDELARLETVVRELEEGQIGLGESLARYEEGVKHLKRCYQLLEQAEQKVELLLESDSAGKERTEPFSEDAMSLEEKAEARSVRRTRRKSKKSMREAPPEASQGDVDDLPGLF